MRVINFIMGLIMIGAGSLAFYVTLKERSRTDRQNTLTRVARVAVGLVAFVLEILIVLKQANIISID
jgi:hypothetical protein